MSIRSSFHLGQSASSQPIGMATVSECGAPASVPTWGGPGTDDRREERTGLVACVSALDATITPSKVHIGSSCRDVIADPTPAKKLTSLEKSVYRTKPPRTTMASFSNVKQLFDIQGRNYIVTGGAQGIGFAIVHALAQVGANVVALDIQTKPNADFDSVAKQFGVNIRYVQADVTDEKGLEAAFQTAFGILGTVHGLVTCAGIALEKAFEQTSWAECRRIQDVNVGADPSECLVKRYRLTIAYLGDRYIFLCAARIRAVQETGYRRQYCPDRFNHVTHCPPSASHVSIWCLEGSSAHAVSSSCS